MHQSWFAMKSVTRSVMWLTYFWFTPKIYIPIVKQIDSWLGLRFLIYFCSLQLCQITKYIADKPTRGTVCIVCYHHVLPLISYIIKHEILQQCCSKWKFISAIATMEICETMMYLKTYQCLRCYSSKLAAWQFVGLCNSLANWNCIQYHFPTDRI